MEDIGDSDNSPTLESLENQEEEDFNELITFVRGVLIPDPSCNDGNTQSKEGRWYR